LASSPALLQKRRVTVFNNSFQVVAPFSFGEGPGMRPLNKTPSPKNLMLN